MSNTIYLVGCAKHKRTEACQAKDLYLGAWFDKASRYARTQARHWYILSAKYGMLWPEAYIDPYDLCMGELRDEAKHNWAINTCQRLHATAAGMTRSAKLGWGATAIDRFVILAGRNYTRYLATMLEVRGYEVFTPLAGLGIGEQMAWLDRRLATINKFNQLRAEPH